MPSGACGAVLQQNIPNAQLILYPVCARFVSADLNGAPAS